MKNTVYDAFLSEFYLKRYREKSVIRLRHPIDLLSDINVFFRKANGAVEYVNTATSFCVEVENGNYNIIVKESRDLHIKPRYPNTLTLIRIYSRRCRCCGEVKLREEYNTVRNGICAECQGSGRLTRRRSNKIPRISFSICNTCVGCECENCINEDMYQNNDESRLFG